MKNALTTENKLSVFHRRRFVARGVIAGVGIAALGKVPNAFAAETPNLAQADSGHDYIMPTPTAKNEKDFCSLLVGPASLSFETSKIAVNKAKDKEALRFANFELGEAIAVLAVLKELGTSVPPMDKLAAETLNKIKNAQGGREFDKAYITAQLENHEYLRDMAISYLQSSSDATSPSEKHTRNLATLTLAVFKEHVVLTKDILKML